MQLSQTISPLYAHVRVFSGLNALSLMQASARLVSTDESARVFWLTPAQANVLANEKDSSTFQMGEHLACMHAAD